MRTFAIAAMLAAILVGPLPVAHADVHYKLFTHPDLIARLPGLDGLWGTSDDIHWSEPESNPNPLGAASFAFDTDLDTFSFSIELAFESGTFTLAEPLSFPVNQYSSWNSTAHYWAWSGNFFGEVSNDGPVIDYEIAAAPSSTVTALSLLSFSSTLNVVESVSGIPNTFGPSFGITLFNDGLRDDIRLLGGDPAGFEGFAAYAAYLTDLLDAAESEWTSINFYTTCANFPCSYGNSLVAYSTDTAAVLPFNVATGVFSEGVVAVIEGVPHIDRGLVVGDSSGGGLHAVLGGASAEHDILLIGAGIRDTLGTVLVAGSSSEFTATSGASVGELGEGRLDISEGARFVSGNGVENFVQVPGNFIIANGGGSRGRVQVHDHASRLEVSGDTFVGNGNVVADFGIDAPAYGALDVYAGGTAVLAGSLFIGLDTRGDGHVAVTGADSAIELVGADRILDVGYGGHGRLQIADGGRVSGAQFIVVGELLGSTGEIVLKGPGSVLELGGVCGFCGYDQGAFLWLGFDGDGSIAITDGAHLTVDGTGTTTPGVAVGGASLYPESAGHGHLEVTGAGSQLNVLGSSGVLEIGGGNGSGELVVADGGVVGAEFIFVGPNGTVSGDDGTLVGSVLNYGTLAPGASPGILHVNGDLVLGDGGRLIVEVGGLVAGIDYDVLAVTGTLTLGGTLEIVLLDGFMPHANDSLFAFFDAANVVGAFVSVVLPDNVLIEFDASGGVRLSAVPVPAAAWLLVSALAGLGRRGHRRKSTSPSCALAGWSTCSAARNEQSRAAPGYRR